MLEACRPVAVGDAGRAGDGRTSKKEMTMRRLLIAMLAALVALGAGCATTEKSGSAPSQYPDRGKSGSGYGY
jgi:hypothetical protein